MSGGQKRLAVLLLALFAISGSAQPARLVNQAYGFSVQVPKGWSEMAIGAKGLPVFANFPWSQLDGQSSLPAILLLSRSSRLPTFRRGTSTTRSRNGRTLTNSGPPGRSRASESTCLRHPESSTRSCFVSGLRKNISSPSIGNSVAGVLPPT